MVKLAEAKPAGISDGAVTPAANGGIAAPVSVPAYPAAVAGTLGGVHAQPSTAPSVSIPSPVPSAGVKEEEGKAQDPKFMYSTKVQEPHLSSPS